MIAPKSYYCRRGQTIGKMIMGILFWIRKVNTNPGFFNLICYAWVIHHVGLLFIDFGLVVLVIGLVAECSCKERLSLHDKIAKTYVVRADDTQTLAAVKT